MKGAIFDLDGTLIDSMHVWDKVDNDLLHFYGHKPDEEYRNAITKLSFLEGAKYIIQRYHIPKTPEEILKQIDEMAYIEYKYHISLKEGVKEYLIHLQTQGIPMIIGTSCTQKLCEAVLQNNGIFSLFHRFVYSNEITGGKRNPDFFRVCADRLGFLCCECTVFEDSVFAAESARSAGCKTIGVYDSYSCTMFDELKKICNHTILSFSELFPA